MLVFVAVFVCVIVNSVEHLGGYCILLCLYVGCMSCVLVVVLLILLCVY